ncbi:unnamed protein product [Parnassius apollo]|uniref:(apollo) hypothetical protein n=1 Tax=Parnassius apollo TaxID=110799 RepID=A0A8S3XM39_PARAO|nr:unnamed protein product [Parnassius apollo]
MDRRKGLFIMLWVAVIPLHKADNLELLLGTLRTHQKAACDEDMVTLICPRGTTISIQVAQYGASASQTSCSPELAEYQPVAVEVVGDTSCTWPSTLQTVVEACQKKRQCKFNTSPKTFGVDPCPGSRRFVEVAYKCRPYEFRSKVGCENDVLHLSCNPHSRVAIYSAQYGRTEYDSIQCPQPRGMKEETCLEPYATETAMRECHGKRRCVLAADSKMFGKPCRVGSRTYLKIVYTCVPRTVLKERYESAPEEDEVAYDISDSEHEDVDETSDRWWGEQAIPPAPAVAAVPSKKPSISTNNNFTNHNQQDSFPSSPRQHVTKSDQFDIMYAYITAAVAVALLVCIIMATVRCVINKRNIEQPKGPDVSATTEVPNGFNDSISEVDNDINITSLSGPVETLDSGLKQEMQLENMTLSPKINRYVGRPVPNTYPHVSSNIYGQVAEYPIEMPFQTMHHGTLGRGVAVKTLPRVQIQAESDRNARSLYQLEPSLSVTEQNLADRVRYILRSNIFGDAELERLRREAVPSSDGNATAGNAAPLIAQQTANVDAAVNIPFVVDSDDDGIVPHELEKMRSILEESMLETRSMPLENRPRLPRIPLSKRNRAVVRALNPMLVTYLEASRDLCETDSILFGAALAVCRIIGAKLPMAGRATQQGSAIPAWRKRIEDRIAKARALIGRLTSFRSGNIRPRVVRTVRDGVCWDKY